MPSGRILYCRVVAAELCGSVWRLRWTSVLKTSNVSQSEVNRAVVVSISCDQCGSSFLKENTGRTAPNPWNNLFSQVPVNECRRYWLELSNQCFFYFRWYYFSRTVLLSVFISIDWCRIDGCTQNTPTSPRALERAFISVRERAVSVEWCCRRVCTRFRWSGKSLRWIPVFIF